MSDCPRAGKLFRGCKFRPRYDTVEAVLQNPAAIFMSGTVHAPLPARRTYICDVCETCGKTLFRRKEAKAQ